MTPQRCRHDAGGSGQHMLEQGIRKCGVGLPGSGTALTALRPFRGGRRLLLDLERTPGLIVMYMRSTRDTGTMGIGQASAASGLSTDTLRYYERESLIGPIGRASNGQRQYSAGDVAWIGVVTCLREAGLGIADLQRFTRLLREASDTTTRVEFLRARRADLVQRVQQLQAAIEVLDDKIQYYAAAQPPAPHNGSEPPA